MTDLTSALCSAETPSGHRDVKCRESCVNDYGFALQSVNNGGREESAYQGKIANKDSEGVW
jgi:hypothetical protein